MQAFTRQLGAQPGIQLNPLRDNTDGFAPDNSDQVFGIAMRATRGRIDKAFRANAGNFKTRLGAGESLRASALNEAHIHVYEALNKGAYQAVIARLVTSAAVLQLINITQTTAPAGTGAVLAATVAGGVITGVTVTNGGTGYSGSVSVTVGGPGSGAVLNPVIVAGVITSVTVANAGSGYTSAPALTVVPNPSATTTAFATSATVPGGQYLVSVKHLECFNDGIKLALHADAVKDGTGTLVANPLVTLRLLDKDGNILYEFQGSFDPAALDDYGQSLYLPDVVSNQTDAVVVTVGVGASIPPDSDAYGRDASNLNKWATSAVLAYFSEGGTGYATADYASAISRLKRTEYDYGYIASGGSQSIALLSQLAQLAFDTNRPFKYDVPGTLTPDAAAAWIAQLNLDSHYCHAFWAPLKSDDPLGLNGKSVIGTSTFNIARACARNAQTNAKGFAPKNFPIAGKEWPLDRTGIIQIYTPDETGQELSDLATAKINPVLFQVYNGGGRYVFTDSLTNAKTAVSMKKLISVAEMSATMDDWITRFGKEAIQLPIEVTIKKMNDFLKKLFEDAQSSGWIIPSVDLAGAAAKYLVQRSEIKPADNVVVTYSLRYDGTTRQITVTQTLSR